MESISYSDAIGLLNYDPMRHLPLIKHACSLKDKARYYKIESESALLVGMNFPHTLTHHDSQLYSDSISINIVSGTYDDGINQYLGALSSGKHVFKSEIDLHKSNHPFHQVKQFYSFTKDEKIPIENCDALFPEKIDFKYESLFSNISYSVSDINDSIENGAKVIVIMKNNIPVTGCIVFQIYNNIWEIGAVATIPEFRKQGLASAIVSIANNYILEHSCIPRYHVESTNTASLGLARKLGFRDFLNFRHYEIQIDADDI